MQGAECRVIRVRRLMNEGGGRNSPGVGPLGELPESQVLEGHPSTVSFVSESP